LLIPLIANCRDQLGLSPRAWPLAFVRDGAAIFEIGGMFHPCAYLPLVRCHR